MAGTARMVLMVRTAGTASMVRMAKTVSTVRMARMATPHLSAATATGGLARLILA